LVCGRVPKFGSGINLSGKLVLDFNYFKKFQVFKRLNPVGWGSAKVDPEMRSGGKKFHGGMAQNSPSCLNGKVF
jgi:hypothetical protein